jgi:hypothetical protein
LLEIPSTISKGLRFFVLQDGAGLQKNVHETMGGFVARVQGRRP